MYRTIPIRARFTDEEKAYWIDQCQNANSLTSLPRYRKKGGLAAVTFPRQALTYKDGCFRPSISKETKPELITQIELPLPEFIDSDWVKEVTIRPSLGELWIDWVIDDGKEPIKPQMGKRGNQNFMPIPTGRLIERLKQLAREYGIVLTLTEEAYTSRASFLDGDSLPKHEKPGSWTPSGTRVKRGLYKASGNRLVNADCNGAGNILRKVAIQLGLNLVKVGKGSLTLPKRYDLFSNLKRSYREQCEALRFQASA